MPHTPRHLIAAVLVSLLAIGSIATPQTSAGSIACDDLVLYWFDVSRAAKANATPEEQAIAQSAVGGWLAYENMSDTDLHIAQRYFEQWAHRMSDFPEHMIPDGLEEYHDIYVRSLQGQSDAILAYLDDDLEAYASISADVQGDIERADEIERAGVAQCGEQWTDVFGEPSNPTPDATPVATPE